MVWAHRQGHWKGKNFSLSFSEEAAKSYTLFYKCIFGHDFLFQRTTIVSGIENYPSTSVSRHSDDLAQLLPCLDQSVVQKYISPRINLCLYHCCCKLCVFVYCRILLLEQSHYLFVSLIPRFQIVMGMEIDLFSLVFLLSALRVDHHYTWAYYEEILIVLYVVKSYVVKSVANIYVTGVRGPPWFVQAFQYNVYCCMYCYVRAHEWSHEVILWT